MWKMGFCKWDFCEKCKFGNAILMKNGLLKWDFCEKCDFENAIFVINVISKMLKILLKMRF